MEEENKKEKIQEIVSDLSKKIASKAVHLVGLSILFVTLFAFLLVNILGFLRTGSLPATNDFFRYVLSTSLFFAIYNKLIDDRWKITYRYFEKVISNFVEKNIEKIYNSTNRQIDKEHLVERRAEIEEYETDINYIDPSVLDFTKNISWRRTKISEAIEKSIGELLTIINNEKFVDEISDPRTKELGLKKLSDTTSGSKNTVYKQLISSLKEVLEKLDSVKQQEISAALVSERNKNVADEFAKEMLQPRLKAEKDGYKSTRKMAEYFNKMGLKSARGKEFTSKGISNLKKRQDELGLIPPSNE